MDARSWSQWHGRIVSVSVNVSPLQFGDHLLERVDRAFSRSGLAPEQLVLEVTESAALDDTGPAAPVIEELRSRKVRFALDDFGTGYSSLTQLARTRFDQIKLDRSFVSQIHLSGADSIIGRRGIALGEAITIQAIGRAHV